MKLTQEDKKHLKEWGYDEKDIPQIEEALKKKNTVYKLEGKYISREKAIDVLGNIKFLSGIARSAFHYSAVRIGNGGRVVYFDSFRLFKN